MANFDANIADPSDLHVLVVEDNLIDQKVTAVMLRKAGCTVHVANHGVECLAFLDKSCYRQRAVARTSNDSEMLDDSERDMPETPLSIILLDLGMPVMDGLACVKRVREMQRSGELSGHVPVLACTRNARSEQVAVSLEAGMDGVIIKPFRFKEPLSKMFDVIQKVKMNEIQRISTGPMGSNG